MRVNVLIKSRSEYRVNRSMVRQTIEDELKKSGVEGNVEIGVWFVGSRKIKDLNKKWRKVDETTDILSFPLENNSGIPGFISSPDEILRLGDIIICHSIAVENAAENNIMVDKEIKDLLKHGVKSLLEI